MSASPSSIDSSDDFDPDARFLSSLLLSFLLSLSRSSVAHHIGLWIVPPPHKNAKKRAPAIRRTTDRLRRDRLGCRYRPER